MTELDLGISNTLNLGPVETQVLVDVFNVTNSNTVLQRQNQIGVRGANGTNSILGEIQSPRIVRVGARLSF